MNPSTALVFLKIVMPKALAEFIEALWVKSGMRNFRRAGQSKRLREARVEAIKRYGVVGADELHDLIRSQGIRQGDVLFVQSSFNDLYTLNASPIEVVRMLQRLVGPEGTLLMPAYTTPSMDGSAFVFDVVRDSTYAGIINEVFRRIPNVTRSLHPRHSICGIGKDAKYILADHEKCSLADGAGSPFDKLRLLPNAKILTLGLPVGYTSFLHWVEDIDPDKLPFPVHEKIPVRGVIRFENFEIEHYDYRVNTVVSNRLCLKNISDRLSKKSVLFIEYKGIRIGVYNVASLANELLVLRDQGIIHYN